VVLVSVFILLPSRVFASSGDESWAFRSCVSTCTKTGCARAPKIQDQTEDHTTLPGENLDGVGSVNYCSPLCSGNGVEKNDSARKETFWLTVSSWDCASDCDYRCMWMLEDKKAAPQQAAEVEKYFGKWPFIRAFGAQEPASVLFSILNLAANMACFFKILGIVGNYRKSNAKGSTSTRSSTRSTTTTSTTSSTTAIATGSTTSGGLKIYAVLWLIHFIVSSNAWLWSSVFHYRDTRLTERFDYFSAGGLVAFNLFLSLTRVSGVVKPTVFVGIGLPIVVMYALHVWRMLNVLFDYGLHVGLCVAAGAVQTAVWLAWAFGSKSGRSHPGNAYLLSFMAAVNIAMLLEVLDFPPLWKIIDAHALWHAATAPLTMLWYRFVEADVALVLGNKAPYKTKS
jgi:hypothetical protein